MARLIYVYCGYLSQRAFNGSEAEGGRSGVYFLRIALRRRDGHSNMRPGIKKLEGDFNKGSIVFVADEKGRTIAIAASLYSKGEIEQMEKGKVLLNLHYLGDRAWRASLDLSKKPT